MALSNKRTKAPRKQSMLPGLTDAVSRGELVVVIGTGISISLTNGAVPAMSWKGLIENGFAYGVLKGAIRESQRQHWTNQLASDDLDDLLSAAEFVSRKLDGPDGPLYARWLHAAFHNVEPTNENMVGAIRALHQSGVPLVTLNYDLLLEKITGIPSLLLNDGARVTRWMRREAPGVLHLHGAADTPPSCILGIRDYERTLSDEVRDLIQRSLWSFKRLLFIGCGDTFEDPNLGALLKWLRSHLGAAAPEHYALVAESELHERHVNPAWQGFLEPVSYGQGYGDLPRFLHKHFVASLTKATRNTTRRPRTRSSSMQHDDVLREYRAFVLKDCGQMTIEGMRADMDTAQRRFDLEKLFVPINVLPTPPDFPANDLDREQKLARWRELHSQPQPFGKVFARHRRLALLALPGGGKSLLLKRLAVAYADAGRRKASLDGLPDFDLVPVMIRCREWRDNIHRPIPALLNNIAEVTGNQALRDLAAALVPKFKQGKALLLVDGLDEIHDDALRMTFVDNLERFLDDHKSARIVVTSREAGFSLVAPTLARFCKRWRLSPLEPDSISALCKHWHQLMVGDSPTADREAEEVTELLLRNDSLRRLAENPLLLTMLLVVKHGAGRLPPDRVTLYARAVDVLLDTWNIKGHDPLSLKEAIPQLACVAFELLQKGKQTATESELLSILDEARERVPHIRRYAKDAAHEFLKRVELRSSLVVEAGHQMDGATPARFYQFRHLTFQEYLAAVAAVEGHYMEYDQKATMLTALEPYLTSEEWKEVIPMAAVLGRKQAEPLMSTLVQQGAELRKAIECTLLDEEDGDRRIPPPVARLIQCLSEEAEASPETLSSALQLVAFFARGCQPDEGDWQSLARGPYGDELLSQAWALYVSRTCPRQMWLRNTYARLSYFRQPSAFWNSVDGFNELLRLISSTNPEDVGKGLLTYCGVQLSWLHTKYSPEHSIPISVLDECLFSNEPFVLEPALWAWGLAQKHFDARRTPPSRILDRLLHIWLDTVRTNNYGTTAAFALSGQAGLTRTAWTPSLANEDIELLRTFADRTASLADTYRLATSLVVGFHARTIWSEAELARRLRTASTLHVFRRLGTPERGAVDNMLAQIAPDTDERKTDDPH